MKKRWISEKEEDLIWRLMTRKSSPPLEVKRESEEKNEPIDPIDPVDAPIDMSVTQKIPRWAQETL